MANKKKVIDLRPQNISYTQDNLVYKVICFKTTNMTVEISSYKKDIFIETSTLPFAHLPKVIKKLIKPV